MMQVDIKYLLGLVLCTVVACAEPYTPDTSIDQPIVVEGYVEAGSGSMITYVLLTRSLPFISELSPDGFEELFIHDALVVVDDGDQEIILNELCYDDLPPALQMELAASLGLDPADVVFNVCAYIDVADQLRREVGRQYDLSIRVEDKLISASTTIPDYVPLYDFRFDDPPGEPSDTYAQLYVTIDDPADIKNFYRYKTAERDEPLVTPFSSVVNDVVYDGQSFEFPLSKAEPADTDATFEEFGLFTRGDSITVKWMCIDEAHFDFWNTRDFSANSAGPFSSYTRIQGNVQGALGIWGGYSVDNYRLKVEVE